MSMTTSGTQINDMVQGRTGSFYRNNGDGTLDCMDTFPATVVTLDEIDDGRLLVRDGQPTGLGNPLATRIAMTLLKRYDQKA